MIDARRIAALLEPHPQCDDPECLVHHHDTAMSLFYSRRAKHLRSLRPDQPCDHPGCLHHVSHPCEGCGRIAGRWPEEKQP